MSAVVIEARIKDPSFHEGDSFWDGDLTLWGLRVREGSEAIELLAVVPRSNGFIPEARVRRFVDEMGCGLAELQAKSKCPGPGRRPNLFLPIEPGV